MAEHKPVIQALGPYCPYPPFRDGVRSRRSHRRTNLSDAKGSNPAGERSTIAAVAVMDQIAGRRSIEATGFRHLLCQPLGCGMRRHAEMNDLPRSVVDHKEHIERAKPDRLHRKQIAGPDFFGMLPEKLPPTWRRLAVPRLSHVLRYSAGADVEPEIAQFSLNALLAPQWILSGHTTD